MVRERLVAAVAEPVEAIEASRAAGSSGAVTSAGLVTRDGMIAKDCVKEPLANFTKRCEQTAEFLQAYRQRCKASLICIITGETAPARPIWPENCRDPLPQQDHGEPPVEDRGRG